LLLACLPTLGLTACSNNPSSPSSASSTSSTAKPSTSVPATNAPMRVGLGTGSIGPANPTTTLPNERGQTIRPLFGVGQNVIISAQGCLPQDLEANVSAPVVWTNLSGKPQRIVFKNFPVDSGTIPAGGTFSWSTTNAIAFAYTLEPSGTACKLAMNQVNP
jgi:hypothetical protein